MAFLDFQLRSASCLPLRDATYCLRPFAVARVVVVAVAANTVKLVDVKQFEAARFTELPGQREGLVAKGGGRRICTRQRVATGVRFRSWRLVPSALTPLHGAATWGRAKAVQDLTRRR
jgi:hypothetical protein